MSKHLHLIARAREGDRQALNQLCTQWYKEVYNMAYHYFSDADRAQEVCQQTFLILPQKLGQLRDPASFRVWLYRLVINRCHMEMRRAKNRERAHEGLRVERQNRTVPDPETLYQQQERSALVLRALQILPEEQRLVIIMKEYRGLTFREIAEVLEISENTTKSRLYYGLKTLRKFFLTNDLKKEVYYD